VAGGSPNTLPFIAAKSTNHVMMTGMPSCIARWTLI